MGKNGKKNRAKKAKKFNKHNGPFKPGKNTTQSFVRPDYSGVKLSWVLPKTGFVFPCRTHITSHHTHDALLKSAMRTTGLPFDRFNVVPLLVAAFEMAAVTCYAVYVTDPDDSDDTALLGAIATCQRGTQWARRLKPAAFAELLLYIRAGRRMFLAITGFDDTDPGSWARNLGDAVDKFDAAVLHRGWGRTRDILALEAADDEDDEYTGRIPASVEKEISEGMEAMDLNMVQEEE